ncbi:YjgN family protein [Chitinophaga pinensis]|uniref:DUF898 domain-containing protein n=1 Tax=Chitinophaga pinensis (strain ATCC 43595 / DSM 2588 / LMG 13176 / NBRC 15968 / NCIMB 11800 / UQM 2034) TaxID=485918 RepID=A0A979G8K2_CHIPD|nr:DUF898 family protein [Chitinophaga pinensis]ACU62657.1 protein of unknown function DUF898 transmembrane [Chitinophaga pinensis DSM 2588]
MEQQYGPTGTVNRPALTYNGDGGTYFGILILNALLTAVTFGFYYPWAKAKKLQYVYSSTELDGSRFAWHGTGKEMFKGFLKAVGVIAALYVSFFLLMKAGLLVAAFVLYFVGIIAAIPFAIHGSNRYHWSRTTWRGIRFGYRGQRNEFILLFVKEMFLTLITFGIYGSWATVNLRTYLVNNIRFGSGEFKYEANGSDYFFMNLKGYFLSILTLGIYSFWWQADMYRFMVDHTYLQHEDKRFSLRSTASGGEFAGLLIVNALLTIFTFGIGYAWVQTRTLSFLMSHVEIEGDVELAQLSQTEEEYRDAMGEDMADLLDLSII